jgi:putative drug exporter of the RND superfamily
MAFPLPAPGRDVFRRLVESVLKSPRAVITVWLLALVAAAPFAWRLHHLAVGGSEAIRGSEAHAVMTTVDAAFGRGFSQLIPVVLTHDRLASTDPEFARRVADLSARLVANTGVRAVLHPWNAGMSGLVGRDGKSVLLLVQPDATTLAEAEAFSTPLRALLTADKLPAGFTAVVTGMSSTYHDLNHRSATDLLHAEMVGIPLTLLVLLFAFRTPYAAGLALAVAGAAVVLSSAVLAVLSGWLPASVLAQNVVTMIGLGAGTDYALFLLSHYREESAANPGQAAIVRSFESCAPAVVIAGLAVAGGFAALFLVNARFVHSLALGGIAVIAVAVLATLTLLPAMLSVVGDRIVGRRPSRAATTGRWAQWASFVMGRPWRFLALAATGSAALAWPAMKTRAWSIGPTDLPADTEARAGFEVLARNFEAGWMGPLIVTLRCAEPDGLWTPGNQRAALAIGHTLASDARIAHVLGFPRLLESLGPTQEQVRQTSLLPAAALDAARLAISPDGRTALILAVPRQSPAAREAIELVDTLRRRSWPEADASDLAVKVGGGAALIRDFDAEMFASVGRVMAAVLLLTFIILLVYFRSIAVPLKAIAANLISVFAAYGFLVLVFQEGIGAGVLGITPPGGLNSFVVLMLFTILFGLSMDYEIFLLSRMRDEFAATGDNTGAVAAGLAGTAGIITSAAAIMVCLFGSFGFFGLTASRQFGLGLAFAVAFDATVVRLLIVPATMRLLGAWNWWLPGRPARDPFAPKTSHWGRGRNTAQPTPR